MYLCIGLVHLINPYILGEINQGMCVSNSLNPVQLVTIFKFISIWKENWYWTFYLLASAVCNVYFIDDDYS